MTQNVVNSDGFQKIFEISLILTTIRCFRVNVFILMLENAFLSLKFCEFYLNGRNGQISFIILDLASSSTTSHNFKYLFAQYLISMAALFKIVGKV